MVSAEKEVIAPSDTENADRSSAATTTIQEEKIDSNEVSPEQTTEFEKLFFDSLVHGVRTAMGDQEEGQVGGCTHYSLRLMLQR